MWWLGQSEAARNAVRFNGIDIRKVLLEFALFVDMNCPDGNLRPWGNGASFDLTIMHSAYLRADIKTPWHFSKERCFRTIRNWYPQVEYNPDDKGDGAHNALQDAIFQARHLFRIKRAVQASKVVS